MSTPKRTFRPSREWVDETMILAERYNENRGVFWSRGEFHEEVVRPGRKYVWTTDQEKARRAAIVPETKAA